MEIGRENPSILVYFCLDEGKGRGENGGGGKREKRGSKERGMNSVRVGGRKEIREG